MIKVKILAFGILKERLGAAEFDAELEGDATVASLLDQLRERCAPPDLAGIAVSVNAEFASASRILKAGDEVGLLPPVSGGSPSAAGPFVATTALTRDAIDAEKLVAAAKDDADGAVVVFDGIVRNQTRGRATLHLDYEAYEEMAGRQMAELALSARERFGVRHVTLIHRLGRLQVGETSVLIVTASAHRAQAFDACRWLIDTLKQTVPIWKKETFADGAVWAAGEPFPAGISVGATE